MTSPLGKNSSSVLLEDLPRIEMALKVGRIVNLATDGARQNGSVDDLGDNVAQQAVAIGS